MYEVYTYDKNVSHIQLYNQRMLTFFQVAH
jgi:hypothetical protein